MGDSYSLGLTAAGVRRAETLACANAYLECRNWTEVRRRVLEENLLELNSHEGRRRLGTELIARLKTLSDEDVELLASATGDDQQALLWVMLCRKYQLLRDLSTDVLAQRWADTSPTLPPTIYEAFVEEQKELHPRLAGASEGTLRQFRTRAYSAMRDCGLLDKENNITPLYPSPALVEHLRETAPEDLGLLPKAGALL